MSSHLLQIPRRLVISRIAFPELKYILFFFFSTRIILTSIGVLSRILLEPYHGKTNVYSDKLWLDIWGVWDAGWYLRIAENGYSAAIYWHHYADYAFFPLYPLLMRGLGLIGNYYYSGIIISNIALLVACVFLYELVKLDEDKDTALRSIKYLFLFPTAFILSGVFTESLFLALALACFYYARKGNWFLVGILGFGLSLTRSIGVFIILPVLYEYLKSKPISKDILCLLLIPSGLFVFMVYNYYLTGDLLAFVHVESVWDRSLANPLRSIYEGLISPDAVTFFLAIFTTISLSFLVIFYTKIRFSYWIFGIYSLIIPLSTGLYSMPRYALVVFPFFILFAQLTKERYIDDILTISLAMLQGCLMVFWTSQFTLVQ